MPTPKFNDNSTTIYSSIKRAKLVPRLTRISRLQNEICETNLLDALTNRLNYPRLSRIQVNSRAGFGTLLLDLLTEEGAGNRQNVFDIDLLSERLVSAIKWVRG